MTDGPAELNWNVLHAPVIDTRRRASAGRTVPNLATGKDVIDAHFGRR